MTAAPPDRTDRHLRRRRFLDRLAEKLILGFASVAIGIILLIFIYVGREALPLLWQSTEGASLAKTVGEPFKWQPVSQNPGYNVLVLLLGTLKVTTIAMVIATPLALAAALFTSEFAGPKFREWIKPAIELLAGIPSVVMGFFALIVLAT